MRGGPGWGAGLAWRHHGPAARASPASRRVDGLERCPPRKGNLSAPPLGRMVTASCFPVWAGREEPSSQLWAVKSDCGERAGDPRCRLAQPAGERARIFLDLKGRPLLPPLLLVLRDSPGLGGLFRKPVWPVTSFNYHCEVFKVHLQVTSFQPQSNQAVDNFGPFSSMNTEAQRASVSCPGTPRK